VIFKSPTCTKTDTKVCKELALIACIEDFKAIGLEMFQVKSQVDGVSSLDLLKRDFKNFDMHGTKVGIGQLEVVDLSVFDDKKDDLIKAMNELKEQDGYDTVLLLLTDIMAMGSLVLVASSSLDNITKAWDINIQNNQFWLDGCLSRKKQIIPYLEPTFK
jgi:manganese-dependent inorganic pyrophosphatase